MYADLNLAVADRIVSGSVDPGLPGVTGDQDLERLARIDLGLVAAGTNDVGGINLLLIDGDLAGGVTLTGTKVLDLRSIFDPYNRAIVFARIKLLIVCNFDTADGHVLYWGPDATGGWDAPVGGVAGAKRPVHPGVTFSGAQVSPGLDLVVAPNLTGLPVDAGRHRILLDAGANAIPYAVLAVGADA